MWRRSGYRGRRPSVDRLADPSPLPGEWLGPFALPLGEVPEEVVDRMRQVVRERLAAGEGFSLDNHDPETCPMCTFRRQMEGQGTTPEERLLGAMADLPEEGPTTTVLSINGPGISVDLTFTGPADLGRELVQEILDRQG